MKLDDAVVRHPFRIWLLFVVGYVLFVVTTLLLASCEARPEPAPSAYRWACEEVARGFSRCQNHEVVCYATWGGGLSCTWRKPL